MRRLVPDHAEEPLDSLYLDLRFPATPERSHVYMGMVASVDGAAAVEGRTAALGGEADALAYSRLRESCDVVLVGSTTAREEDYGPPRLRPGGLDRRRARGQAPFPTIVVVTASVSLEPDARLFSDPERRPTILTVADADEDRRARLARRADIVTAGRGQVDLAAGLAVLRERGFTRVLLEGGPSLNAQMVALGLVDELFLTISPHVVGVSDRRIVEGPVGDGPRDAELSELRVHDGELLLRYRLT